MYYFEDGNCCSPGQFWEDRQGVFWENGWSIWEEKLYGYGPKNSSYGNSSEPNLSI